MTWKAEYPDHEQAVRRMIEVEKLTQDQVAELLGKNRTTIQRWCKRFGLETQRTGPRNGPLHPGWKGGRKLVGRYWYVYAPWHPLATKQRCVAEHRLVAENKLGRYLTHHEVVHHRDRNPQNNSPGNLEVFPTNGAHLRHELTGRVPNWTLDGKRRIAEAVARISASRRSLKSGGHRRTRTSGHQTS